MSAPEPKRFCCTGWNKPLDLNVITGADPE
jgi:hypothetical protein